LSLRRLAEYRIHNAEVLFREDATVDDLIDVIEGACLHLRMRQFGCSRCEPLFASVC
jgi:hypothetical protein